MIYKCSRSIHRSKPLKQERGSGDIEIQRSIVVFPADTDWLLLLLLLLLSDSTARRPTIASSGRLARALT
jgi:hypothetical protein